VVAILTCTLRAGDEYVGFRFGCNRGARRLPKTANKFPWRIGQLGWAAVLITPNIRFLAADAVRRVRWMA
jgi:hypothetical protein